MMTIADGTILLWKWFLEHDTYSHKEFGKLVLLSDDYERDRAAISGALNEFTKMELVSYIKEKETDYWVLKKSFSAHNQTVSINSHLALAIAETLNAAAEDMKDPDIKCDPMHVQDSDIANLLNLHHQIMKDIDDEENT